MNWFIISVGVAIVLALTAAVVGPHFIDWTLYRAQIEANAERALGTEVAFAGGADVRILPRPRVTVENVTLGPASRPLMMARRVEMQLELTPLLKREIQITNLAIEAPIIFARISPNGRMELPDLTAEHTIASYFDVSDVMIDTVTLTDATLVVVDDRTGVRRTLDNITLSGSARSLKGPFNLAGSLKADGWTQNVSISAGALDNGTIPLSVRLAPVGTSVAMTFDGALSPQPTAPGLAGSFAVTSASGVPWSIQGDMALDPVALRLGRATLSYGEGDTPMQLAGSAVYNLTKSDPIALAFAARQMDLDRVDRALRETEEPTAPADMLDRLVDHLSPAVSGLGSLTLPNVPITADIDIGTLIAGGAVTRDVSVRLATGASGLTVERAEALLPGDTHVETNGRITSDGYAGAVRVSASQPSIFAHWWSGEEFAGAVVDPILVEADIDATSQSLDARRLSIRVGESRATGRWRMRSTPAGRKVDISLGAPIVDVDDVMDAVAIMPRRLVPTNGTDVSVNLTVDRVVIGSVEGSTLNVNASYADGTLQIDALEADRFGGISVFAIGQLGDLKDEPIGSITGTIKVVDGDALAASVRQLFPLSDMARRFGAIAPHLAPGDFSFRIVGDTAPDAPKLAVSLDGSANGTSLTLETAGNPFDPDWTSRPASLSLDVANADASILAQQFGLVPPEGSGPGSLTLRVDGTPATGADTEVRLTAFGTTLGYAGGLRYGEDTGLDGHLTADAETLGPLASLTDLPLPAGAALSLGADVRTEDAVVLDNISGMVDGVAVAGGLRATREGISGSLDIGAADLTALTSLILGPNAWSGTGDGAAWPATAFARIEGPALPVTLDIAADSLALGRNSLADARFKLDLARDRLTISDASGRLADGEASGSLQIARNGAAAELSGAFDLTGANVAPLLWTSGGEPVAEGTLSLATRFMSRGYTVADLVTALEGEGTLSVADGRLRAFNAAPFDWPDASGAAPQEGEVRDDFVQHLGAADTRFDTLTADIAIANGTARLSHVAFDPPQELTVSTATFDLGAWQLRADVSLRTIVSGTPAVPIGVIFAGPMGEPDRAVDVSRLTAWAALRSIERQVEAVESDNEALAAEADAQGAPSSRALEELGVAPGTPAAPSAGQDGGPDPAGSTTPSPLPPLPAPPEDGRSAGTGAPTPAAPAGPAEATPAQRSENSGASSDPVGDYIRNTHSLDPPVTTYESREPSGDPAADGPGPAGGATREPALAD
ncbi:AsmA family protein [Acuticoccus sediminis]|uniref:AsmA family protein n=1 Tax=Acuticoccus sediminis TaxID=2184697 RepID=UPI001CFDEBDC|nr:AsmA family protein [Acuticoccus sediminis]